MGSSSDPMALRELTTLFQNLLAGIPDCAGVLEVGYITLQKLLNTQKNTKMHQNTHFATQERRSSPSSAAILAPSALDLSPTKFKSWTCTLPTDCARQAVAGVSVMGRCLLQCNYYTSDDEQLECHNQVCPLFGFKF